MTSTPAKLEDLLAVRERVMSELPRALLPRHRQFLLSMVSAEPDWSCLPYHHVHLLQAVQWKLRKLAQLRKNASKFALQHEQLVARFAAIV